VQAKELEIFDVQAFLSSRLFKNNGYSRKEGDIFKSFSDEL
jgi:DNA replication licensing factor MCM2